MNTHDIETVLRSFLTGDGYIAADDIPAICATIEADRKRRVEPVAWRWSESNGERWFDWTTDWSHHDRAAKMGCLIEYAAPSAPQPAEPDYKQLFEQMCERCDALDAKLAEYSEREPVGYIMPTALKQLRAGGNAIVGGTSQGFDVPIYTAPQPAEPVKRKRRYAQGTALGEFGIIPMCDQVDDEPVKVPSDDVLVDALANLEHDNYEKSYSGYKNRQADVELIRAALAAMEE